MGNVFQHSGGRRGQPSEIGEGVVWLLSDASLSIPVLFFTLRFALSVRWWVAELSWLKIVRAAKPISANTKKATLAQFGRAADS